MSLPSHIAFIMDGNGRWGNERKDRFSGYISGIDVMFDIMKYSLSVGIKYLTFYAFSSENFFRSSLFLSTLFHHFEMLFLTKKPQILNSQDINYNFIGDLSKFSQKIVNEINEIVYNTRNNCKMYVNIALGYGARNEIIYAIKNLFNSYDMCDIKKVINNLDYDLLSKFMYTSSFPDPDLLIRTGGKKRLSNFLLLQSSYSELYFTDLLWPDFSIEELQKAINDFISRERKYGR